MAIPSQPDNNGETATYHDLFDEIEADNDWQAAVDAAFLGLGPLDTMLEELRGYDFIHFPYSDLNACEAVMREGARRGYHPHRDADNTFVESLLGDMLWTQDRLDALLDEGASDETDDSATDA